MYTHALVVFFKEIRVFLHMAAILGHKNVRLEVPNPAVITIMVFSDVTRVVLLYLSIKTHAIQKNTVMS